MSVLTSAQRIQCFLQSFGHFIEHDRRVFAPLNLLPRKLNYIIAYSRGHFVGEVECLTEGRSSLEDFSSDVGWFTLLWIVLLGAETKVYHGSLEGTGEFGGSLTQGNQCWKDLHNPSPTSPTTSWPVGRVASERSTGRTGRDMCGRVAAGVVGPGQKIFGGYNHKAKMPNYPAFRRSPAKAKGATGRVRVRKIHRLVGTGRFRKTRAVYINTGANHKAPAGIVVFRVGTPKGKKAAYKTKCPDANVSFQLDMVAFLSQLKNKAEEGRVHKPHKIVSASREWMGVYVFGRIPYEAGHIISAC